VTEEALDAGDFSTWLASINGALRGEHGTDVPCGTCTACCTASQFVHIEPDEADTLAHIPGELLFPAPRMPPGHVVMGYDEHGHCPMLIDNRCSIYEHRPRSCRVYDCRVFAASGVAIDGAAQEGIADRVRRWQFRFPAVKDDVEYASVRRAAEYLSTQEAELEDEFGSLPAAQRALLSLQISQLFLHSEAAPSSQAVRVELRKRAG
jgi:uncharacterized protein